jgi:DNA-binding transcriptional MocR family regulator
LLGGKRFVNRFQRRLRASIYAGFRDSSTSPSIETLATALEASREEVAAGLRALADEHCVVLVPGTGSIWMAHPFSGVETDFVVSIGDRQWFANCVWDGLSILALFGDGSLDTHSPATGRPLRFEAVNGVVNGPGIVHFLVPARSFWDDIGYT